MKLKTHKNDKWRESLQLYIIDCNNKDFCWGEFDCCLFVLGAIDAITGSENMQKVKGIYNNKQEAKNILGNYFNGSIIKTFNKNLLRLKNPMLARFGDFCYYKGAIGIVLDSKCAFVNNKKGLVFVDIVNIKKAWRL